MVWLSEIRKGDKIVVQDNNALCWTAVITSSGHGSMHGTRIEDGVPVGRVRRIYANQIVGREGGPIEKHGGNLVPGDLIYTPHHKSGLQYARITKRDRWGNTFCLRWNEAGNDWTKTARNFNGDEGLEWLGHENEVGALDRFHARVSNDRVGWLESPGRTAMAPIPDEKDTFYTRVKQRRWQGTDLQPVMFSEPMKWDDDTKPPTPIVTLWRRIFGR